MKTPFSAAVFAAILGTSFPVSAHDFWIELSDYAPAVNQPVKVLLRSGHAPTGDPIPRPDNTRESFVLLTGSDSRPIPGIAGRDPAGYLRAHKTSPLVVAYSSPTRRITLDAQKFAEHLIHEGLDTVRSTRETSGLATTPAREAYTKYAKCLLRTKDSADVSPLPIAGHVLEIVPDTDPTGPDFRGEFTGRVLFKGAGAPGLLISALSPTAEKPVQARTDGDGRFSLPLPQSGVWVVKTVRMNAATDPNLDWESQWASLVFQF